MDVSRLLSVFIDIEAEYKGGLSKLLTDLIQQYTIARDSPAQDNSPAIQKSFNSVVEYTNRSVFFQYTPSKATVLKAIGGNRCVGKGFNERLKDLLSVSGQTTAGIVTGLTNLQTDIEKFRKACGQARAGLELLNLASHTIPAGQFEVGVLIPERLVDSKLGTLVKELDGWNKIVRGFQEVAGEEEREVTVAGIASGSYEIYLPIGILAATLVSRTIDKVLEWYLRILEIRKRRLELKELGAPVAEVTEIKNHEKNLLKKEIEKLAKDLVKEVHPKVGVPRQNELETHLTISIRQIARFVDRGGTVEVDSTPPDEPEEPSPPKGDEVTPEQNKEYERLKSEFTHLSSEFQRVTQILNAGGALIQLPERPEPILQLNEVEPDIINNDLKPTKKKE